MSLPDKMVNDGVEKLVKRIRELEAELLKARKLSDHWMVKHDELQALNKDIREDYQQDMKDYGIHKMKALITELRGLKRYNNVNESYYMEDNELGLWVRHSDITALLEKKDD